MLSHEITFQTPGSNHKLGSTRKWIVLNSRGESMVLELEKYVIMRRIGIDARDLRILDPLLSYPSTIFGREQAIILNLEHIKAIITAEEVLLCNPSDENVVPVIEELYRRLAMKFNVCDKGNDLEFKNDGSKSNSRFSIKYDFAESPFEFRALEVVLEAICSFLDARATELETSAYPALDQLITKISSRNLDRIRKLKSSMARLTSRVQKVRDEVEQILDDDTDMANFLLTRKHATFSSPASGSQHQCPLVGSPTIGSRISRASKTIGGTLTMENDVEQLEMLLEAYYMQIDGTLSKLLTLREYINDTEDYINIQLDNHRNQLIQLELILNAANVALSLYAAVAGVFGMNIPYTWMQGHGYVFKWVVLLSGVASCIIFSSVLFYARYKGLIGN